MNTYVAFASVVAAVFAIPFVGSYLADRLFSPKPRRPRD